MRRSSPNPLLHIAPVLLLSLLAGCGGGKGGTVRPSVDPGVSATESGSDSAPVTHDYTLGAQSTEAAAEQALPNEFTSIFNSADPVATTDTGARQAWGDGWTGLGVKVGVSDVFNLNDVVDTHGDWVSFVIGSVAPEAEQGLYAVLNEDGSAGFYEMFDNAQLATSWYLEHGYLIVNNSWGVDRAERDSAGEFTGVLTAAAYWADLVDYTVANLPTANNNPQMLNIFAAGNGAEYCGGGLEACDLIAAAVFAAREAGVDPAERMVWVGAINDAGTALAPYSYPAGAMADDYLVAHDDVLRAGDAAGTSFAAPRVTGAAALLRHKFPNLDGAAIKQVLLQTAFDMGEPGVDIVYGHGLLDIPNAMSPQGKVVPQ